MPFANADFPPVGWNPAYYYNSRVVELYQEAPYVTDPAQREAMWGEIRRIMMDDAPYAWLGQFTNYYVFRSNGIYSNVILSAGLSLDYGTIYPTAE